jgi:uncharacterized protein with GYD domain
MSKFLVQASYTADGVKGLMKEGGSSRKASVEKSVEGLGGKVESFYYAFGETDAVVILDVPDAATAVAVSLAVNASGAVRTHLTPLITVEEIDAACKKTVGYRPPGS